MSIIDASQLGFAFNAGSPPETAHDLLIADTPGAYTWATGAMAPFNIFTLFSYANDITPGLEGTIAAGYITNDVFGPGISINGLPDIALNTMIDVGNLILHHEMFWASVLQGDTTVILPERDREFILMGDYVNVLAGQDLTGGNDVFRNEEGRQTSGILIGDAMVVNAGGILRGGNDLFDNAWNSSLVGDAGSEDLGHVVFGTVFGGDDVFTLENTVAFATRTVDVIVGDTESSQTGAMILGGDDTITVRGASFTGRVVGDTLHSENSNVHGGDDMIMLEAATVGADYVTGDSFNINNTSGLRASSGGDDTITLRDVNVFVSVTGDADRVTQSLYSGGDDTLDIRGVLDAFRTGIVSGDVRRMFDDTSTLTAGNDSIVLVDVAFDSLAGDGHEVRADSVRGGSDTITFLYRADTDQPRTVISGDVDDLRANSFTGGDDVLAVNTIDSSTVSSIELVGDAHLFTTGPGTTTGILNGDDAIRITAHSGQNVTLYGDIATLNYSNTLSLRDGNDTLTAGGGDDMIYGDTAVLLDLGGMFPPPPSHVFGNDVLDGRGGNDTLDGGGGTDTVVFSLHQAVHVNLGGIAGTAAPMGDLYEAVGQGQDQLISIENLIGSSQGDILIGDTLFNTIEGGAGADRIDGGGGSDTASYAGSAAGVVVNLLTGVTAGGDAAGDRFTSIERLLGSAQDDVFVGTNIGNYIDGGAGADYMRGLGGSDTYVIDNTGDQVDESFTGSGGIDTVRSTVSINLTNTANFNGAIENVVLTGSSGTGAVGNSLSNTIVGNSAGNVIAGGLGNDMLTGSGGYDRFVFNTALDPMTNMDTITDYALADQINLENAVFTALTSTGFLSANLFKDTAMGAVDADDRIIYNSASGGLFYDTDGSGAAAAVQFAGLSAGLALTAGEFFVV